MTRLGSSAQVLSQGRYARVMGNLWRHEKTANVGDAALGLLMRMLSYCADQGVSSVGELRMVELFRRNPHGRRQLNELIAAGFVDRLEGGGYTPHDWSQHNRVTKPALHVVPQPAGEEGGKANLRRTYGEDKVKPPPEIIQEATPSLKTQDPGPSKEEEGEGPPPAPDEPERREPSPQKRIAELEAQLDSPALLADTREAVALSRRNGKVADSVWLKTLQALATFDRSVALEAMHTFTERHADGDKNERYLLGIARNTKRRFASGQGPQLRRVNPVDPAVSAQIRAHSESFARYLGMEVAS